MRCLLVLILLVAPVAAQSFDGEAEDQDAVYAPVQLLLDQYPELMRLAIAESEFDGTPHDANELVAQMQAYFAGFNDRPAWPEGSLAAETAARDAYGRVGALLDTAALIPDRLGSLSRVDAGCKARPSATGDQATAWWASAFDDVDQLDLLRGSLRLLALQVETPLDAAPVEASAEILDAWLATTVVRVQICLEELYIRNGLGAPSTSLTGRLDGEGSASSYLRLILSPSKAYPSQEVFVTGRVVGLRDLPASIAAPTLGWQATVPVQARGYFSSTFRVPTNAGLGDHAVQASSGELRGEATLDVVKAPVTLDIKAPGTVFLGKSFTIRASATSPLPLAASATITIDGASHPATGGEVRHTAPEAPTTLRYTIAYAGDARHEAASRTVAVTVKAPPLAAEEEATPWEVLEKGIWFAPEKSGGGDFKRLTRPEIEAGQMIAITATVLVFGIIELALSARRPPAIVAPAAAPTPQGPRWPHAFAQAFAALAAFLVGRNLLPPGATPRDIGRHLAQHRIGNPAMVRDFELVRYGQARIPDEASSKRSGIIQRLWRRLGGQ